MSNERKINLSILQKSLSEVHEVEIDRQEAYMNTLPVFDMLLNKETITKQELLNFTVEQFEWAMDTSINVPGLNESYSQYEGEFLFEFLRSQELIEYLEQLPPAQQTSNIFI